MKKNSLRKFIVLAMVALMIVTVLSGCTPPADPNTASTASGSASGNEAGTGSKTVTMAMTCLLYTSRCV